MPPPYITKNVNIFHMGQYCQLKEPFYKNRVQKTYESVVDTMLKLRAEDNLPVLAGSKLEKFKKAVEEMVQTTAGFNIGPDHVCQSRLIPFENNKGPLAQIIAFELSRIYKEVAAGRLSVEEFKKALANPDALGEALVKESGILTYDEGDTMLTKLQDFYNKKYGRYRILVYANWGKPYFVGAFNDNHKKSLAIYNANYPREAYGVMGVSKLFHKKEE